MLNAQTMEKQTNKSNLCPTLLAFIVIYCVWLLAVKFFLAKKPKNLPPSPPKLPIVGNLHLLLGHLVHRSLDSLSKKYGPLMWLQLGIKPLVVISSSDVAKEVTKNHDIAFSDKPDLTAARQLFYGRKGLIFSPHGDQWRKLRSIFVNNLLHKRMIKTFKSFRDEETSSLVETLDKFSSTSTPVDLTLLFKCMANDMICKSAFGKKYMKGEEGNTIMRTIEEMVQLMLTFTVGEFIPWLAWTNRWTGFNAALDRVSKTKDELLEMRLQEYETSSSGNSFLNIFLGLHKNDTPGVSIDREMLKAIVQDVLGAGTDTTATTLGWVMTELIRHPKIMKKLQDEVREVVNGKQEVTDSELDKMPYLKAVIKESLRLHCPVPIGLRQTNEDVQVMGYEIPSGTMVMFNLWAICRDPSYWDEPEKFWPERFLNSSVEYNGVDYHFIPFGCGRRICPGMYFATASVEHVLANLMLKFDWQLPNGVRGEDLDVEEKPGLAVGRKNPLIVIPTRCSL